jgi:hypothetical protein
MLGILIWIFSAVVVVMCVVTTFLEYILFLSSVYWSSCN